MELRDLRTFAVVAEIGSMTRAAQRLHLVQSAVSQAVKRLEGELGVALLERGPGGVATTEAGRVLVRHANAISGAVSSAERDMAAFRELETGTVALGLLHTTAPLVLPGLLRRLRVLHPGLELHVEEGAASQIEEALRLGRLDLAVLFLPVEFPGLEIRSVGTTRLAIAVPVDHPHAGRRRLRLRELADESWISFGPANPGRRWLEEACASAGFLPRVEVAVDTLAQVKLFVEAGRGIAMIPPSAAAPEHAAELLQLIRVADPAPVVTIGYAFDPRRSALGRDTVGGLLESVLRDAALGS